MNDDDLKDMLSMPWKNVGSFIPTAPSVPKHLAVVASQMSLSNIPYQKYTWQELALEDEVIIYSPDQSKTYSITIFDLLRGMIKLRKENEELFK